MKVKQNAVITSMNLPLLKYVYLGKYFWFHLQIHLVVYDHLKETNLSMNCPGRTIQKCKKGFFDQLALHLSVPIVLLFARFLNAFWELGSFRLLTANLSVITVFYTHQFVGYKHNVQPGMEGPGQNQTLLHTIHTVH